MVNKTHGNDWFLSSVENPETKDHMRTDMDMLGQAEQLCLRRCCVHGHLSPLSSKPEEMGKTRNSVCNGDDEEGGTAG
jgi:hypothetical protein